MFGLNTQKGFYMTLIEYSMSYWLNYVLVYSVIVFCANESS